MLYEKYGKLLTQEQPGVKLHMQYSVCRMLPVWIRKLNLYFYWLIINVIGYLLVRCKQMSTEINSI